MREIYLLVYYRHVECIDFFKSLKYLFYPCNYFFLSLQNTFVLFFILKVF